MEPNSTTPLENVIWDSLLDWPVLLFFVIIVMLWKFHGPLGEAIRNRGLTVEIGGNKVTVGEAVEDINKEQEETLSNFQEKLRDQQSEIDELKDAIVKLKEGTTFDAEIMVQPAETRTPEQEEETAWQNIRSALLHGKFVWRSLDRLSILANISPDEVRRILAAHPDEAVMGIGKSKRAIARHKSRTP